MDELAEVTGQTLKHGTDASFEKGLPLENRGSD